MQGVLERRIARHQLVEGGGRTALGQLVAGEVANPFQGAQVDLAHLVGEGVGLGAEQLVEEA
ncbi:hypothetical protein D3C72_2431380 [compost metagenome]